MNDTTILLFDDIPQGCLERWQAEFADCAFFDARPAAVLEQHLERAVVAFGLPPVDRLHAATRLRWVQLTTAGVRPDFRAVAQQGGLLVTNLSGQYGTPIAEHTLALMMMLARNLHVVLRNQWERRWDNSVAQTMANLHGQTVALVGLGDIGLETARLCKALGMRVVGCRRTDQPTPGIDRLYPLAQLHAMLAEADFVAVNAPLTRQTERMLGAAECAAMKRGVIFINVSRGAVTREDALLDALRSGHVAAVGLDAYVVEPLPPEHPFWSMPQVIVGPHYSGDTVNLSALPAERFARNLRAWRQGLSMEGVVDLEQGY